MAPKKQKSKDYNKDDFATSSEAPNNPEFDKGGKNIRPAIENSNQARELARKLDEDDRRGRDSRRALVQGAFNGNAPFSPSWLKSQGLDWHFNVSFNHMAGVIGRATVPYTRFGLDIRYLTRFMGEMEDWRLDRLRVEYVKAIKRWGRWPKFYTRLIQELNLMGWSTSTWLDEFTPWPEFSPQSRTFVPDESPNDVDDVDVIVVKKHYLLHQLYSKIENSKQAKAAGWNVKNVRACLMSAQPKRLENTKNWEEFEKAIRGGYIYWSYTSAKVVTVYHVFVREISGKVSHWAVEYKQGDADVKKTYGDLEDSGLFEAKDQFESMNQVCSYFDAEPGDSNWHGPRGAGQRAYNTHVNRDKLLNGILTSTFISLLLPIKVPDELRGDQLDTFVALPFCQVPSGVELLADKLPGVTQDVFSTDALLTANAEQTTGDVVPSGKAPYLDDKQKTATQSNIDATRQNELRQSGIERFVDPFAKMHGEIFRRLCKKNSQDKDAKKFQKRLAEVGVLGPKDTLSDLVERVEVLSFYEIKDVTGEAAAASQMIFQDFRGDPAVEQRPLYEDRVRTVMGPEAVLRYLPEEANKIEFDEAARKQQMEIAALVMGQNILVLPNDKHEAEAPEVIKWLTEAFDKAIKTGGGPPIDRIQAIIEHADQHVLALAQDKRYKTLASQMASQLAPMKQIFQQIQAATGQPQNGNGGALPPPNGIGGPNNGSGTILPTPGTNESPVTVPNALQRPEQRI